MNLEPCELPLAVKKVCVRGVCPNPYTFIYRGEGVVPDVTPARCAAIVNVCRKTPRQTITFFSVYIFPEPHSCG